MRTTPSRHCGAGLGRGLGLFWLAWLSAQALCLFRLWDLFPALHLPATVGAPPVQVNTRYPGGCSKGELTMEGRCQAQDFGAWLRWRYMMVTPFLPDTSAPEVCVCRPPAVRCPLLLPWRRGNTMALPLLPPPPLA